MLRNKRHDCVAATAWLLNEVLSLNAQESDSEHWFVLAFALLNEVLSLNAQESEHALHNTMHNLILNEVLSLNAQE